MTVLAIDEPAAALSADERAVLEAHELIIDQGLKTFYDVGTSLLDIQAKRLYRGDYPTFEDYCLQRWSISRPRAYQLMTAAAVVEGLSTNGRHGEPLPLPANERQARALAHFDEPLRPAILRTAQARYGELTESNISRVGNVIQEMATTGHVDIGNGTSTPIDAALGIEDEEAFQRQQIHIEERLNGKHKPKTNRAEDDDGSQGYDRCQSPDYAIDPLLPYLPREWTIWESACGEGLMVGALYDSGFTDLVATDQLTGKDFFEYEPGMEGLTYDAQVTNPPYSLKYRWLKRCYELGKPFALLLPLETLGSKAGQTLFREYGVELILFDKRINFKMPNLGWDGGGAQFPTAWFTWGLDIGQQLTFVEATWK